ncbi:MAG TPA: transposase [Ignavibacteriales bacterium]|nr:transposase [Ignavibacteriales bacterium]
MGLRGRTNFTDERIFFVTTTVMNYMNVFSDHKACRILIDNIKHYQQRYRFTILAYAIMPSHFHWVVIVDPKYGSISDIMRDIKKYSAWDIMEYISKEYPETGSEFKASNDHPTKQKRKFWMDRFDDEVIRDEKMYFQVLNYIHNNPVKAGLAENPEDYIFSSARNYLGKGFMPLEVDVSYAGIQIL